MKLLELRPYGGTMKYFLSFVILMFLLVTPAQSQYVYGDPVNDFSLPDSENQTVSLFDYSDRIVFLVFWEVG